MAVTSIYETKVKTIQGKDASWDAYKGEVLLIVNVASKCGLTPQYEGLEALYSKYRQQGFQVLGFPANEFGAQEPGTNEEIKAFCTTNFGVKFPMFEKIVVKGPGQHDLYRLLTLAQPEAKAPAGEDFEQKLKGHGITRETKSDILWNFEKFLINRRGDIVARFAPSMKPDDPILVSAIEKELHG
jgi:glutathione peroxidase